MGELTKKQEFKGNLEKMAGEFKKALPSHIDHNVFVRTALTTFNKNPRLLECTQPSIFGSLMQAAQLGLMPDGLLGQAHLIPYRIKNVMTCNFQVGYKGIIQLIRRTDKVTGIVAQCVYKQDEFKYNLVNGVLNHVRSDDTSFKDSDITHFYAIIHYKDGGNDFAVLTNFQVQKHMKKYSKGYQKNDSPWNTDYPAMGKKTAILQAAKYAEISTEVQKAISLDEMSVYSSQRNSALVNDKFDDFEEVKDIEVKDAELSAQAAKNKVKDQADKAIKAAEKK